MRDVLCELSLGGFISGLLNFVYEGELYYEKK